MLERITHARANHVVQPSHLAALMCCALLIIALAGCSEGDQPKSSRSAADALPSSAYELDPSLPEWIDPDTGYDTSREWKLEGGTWPVALIMSPSQSPQLLAGERDGVYTKALKQFGITPKIERIDLPPRTFRALQRSKWPFVYMPYAVFTDYSRAHDNQGGAGGLQYVALAGSTQGGGYTLITKDPAINSVADLKGKTVAGLENNPARIVLMQSAAQKAGLKLGTGDGDIRFSQGASSNELNDYLAGKYDALIVLSIVKERFLRTGSRALTDFTDVAYTPNYTILCVERSVLEKRPEVVDAVLEAHYQGNLLAQKEKPEALRRLLMESWNGYFRSQDSTVAAQRIAPDAATFDRMLGNMTAQQRLDPNLLGDAFKYLDEEKAWGWAGTVDASKLTALDRYDKVLASHGEKPQASVSR